MSGARDLLVRTVCVAAPALTAAGACLLPVDTLALIVAGLTAWACASVPIGMLVGHCALGEE